ncbi:hypothetical protein ASPWEDRAFT_177523 [Aspergillus wentii DTO 134E9]|uniref:Major facilitator superfamily (MFS) profile domain-containing protein n=1 Tax=Aspergillus wentii DTO 134E9 TaxID=1073089 RepID=A0A1L9R4H6_ASPWE|nr:uncharacterized protein ASPWEDRAFT_177523 [Aspergillus wentii DTO 134E9]OJJ29783.1 hypothetical protein ASPWEDRAFT_177523 [Aspergillus wentii DTO 134E9]
MQKPLHSHQTRRNRNPLKDRTPEELEDDVRNFHQRLELGDVLDLDLLLRAARIARDPTDHVPGITPAEEKTIRSESESEFYQQTKDLKVTILAMACAAITQGWQQSTINVTSMDWQIEFGQTDNALLAGLVDAAPWLSGSLLGTWLSDPLQEGRYGRRPALFISAIFCAACVLGSARCRTWQQLLACRVLLGIGIGAKASIAPVFAAEAAVDHLRGRLLMMWQLFDTFGIFIGFACVWIVDRSWRVLLGSAAVPALILLFLVFVCPESPRFLIRKNRYKEAFESLRHLRKTDLQAARDLYYIHTQLQIETELLLQTTPALGYNKQVYQQALYEMGFFQRVWALWVKPRNRRACLAAFLVMAAQQLCGINVIAFYSSTLFSSSRKQPDHPISQMANDQTCWLNFGFGLSIFLFTIPAYKYIDGRGRRILLLISLVGMLFTLLAVGFFFRITNDDHRNGLVATFLIIVFTFFYGIGAGPVPFTLSAEVFPLAFREVGMSFSVMINFLGLGLLVLFVPKLTEVLGKDSTNDNELYLRQSRFGQSNLLFLFTGLNALTFVLVFLFVPSGTARVSLEEMNFIFNTKTSVHVKNHIQRFKEVLFRRDKPVDDEQYDMRSHASPV